MAESQKLTPAELAEFTEAQREIRIRNDAEHYGMPLGEVRSIHALFERPALLQAVEALKESLADGFDRLLKSLDEPLSANQTEVFRVIYDLQGKPVSLKELHLQTTLSQNSITTHIVGKLKKRRLIGQHNGYYLLAAHRQSSI